MAVMVVMVESGGGRAWVGEMVEAGSEVQATEARAEGTEPEAVRVAARAGMAVGEEKEGVEGGWPHPRPGKKSRAGRNYTGTCHTCPSSRPLSSQP